MNKQRYHYHQIDGSSQIRLLTMIPRQDQKRVHLKLDVVSLHEVENQYEAVSYMWGPQTPERHILVDGKTLKLRDNIWRCLKHLRDHGMSRPRLWIDSICINQNDEDEKSLQVAMMAQVFQKASRVLIWLGSTSLKTYLLTPGEENLRHSIEHLPADDGDAWIGTLAHDNFRSQLLIDQMMSIIYNDYWERLWIVQEVLLSQNACIVFGSALLDERCFYSMYLAVWTFSESGYHHWIARQRDPNIINSGTVILDHHPICLVGRHRQTVRDFHDERSLRELIQEYHWHHCTDQRDYVFALAGFLDSNQRLEIDYKLSNEAVLIKALQCVDEESVREYDILRGLDWWAAAALVRALKVTSLTYSTFEQNLAVDSAERLKRFRLTIRHGLLIPVDENTPPDSDFLHFHLINGRIKRFACVRPEDPLSDKSGVVHRLVLGYLFYVIARTQPDRTIKIEHFAGPLLGRIVRESNMNLEIQLTANVKKTLERELNACHADWSNLDSISQSDLFVHLSALEVISICELIAINPSTMSIMHPRPKEIRRQVP